MDTATLANLGAYSLQLACVVLLAAALAAALRIDVASVRYTFWRAVLALCLLLPWIQPHHEPVSGEFLPTPLAAEATMAVAGVGAGAAARSVDWVTIVMLVLAGGAALRLIWMAASFARLRRLRGAGRPIPLADDVEALQSAVGARADIRYVAGLGQPVTFGTWRPVVLLPDAILEYPPEIQRAVLCHELVHVARRDWLWLLAEETLRAALWFNPAAWWLISRVQLAREEAVDEQAVLVTGRRRTYLKALMAFADEPPLAPAPAFARRRHLFRRMVLVSREAVMSSRRIVLSCAVMAVVIAAGSWYAVGAFPLSASPMLQQVLTEPGPMEKRANPITPENPIPRRISATEAVYPASVLETGARGSITMRVTLDELGRVAEMRQSGVTVNLAKPGISVTLAPGKSASDAAAWTRSMDTGSSPARDALPAARSVIDAFTAAAAEALAGWRYDAPANGPISLDVRFAFSPDAPTLATQAAAGTMVGVPGGVRGGAGGGVGGGIGGGVGAGNAERRAGGTGYGVSGGVSSAGVQAPLRVGGNIKAPTKIRDVKPVYPDEARAAGIQGVVIIEAYIEPDGTVSNARVLRSIPMLDQPAVDAVMQWQFTPTLLNGQAVPIVMTVTVNFRQ